MTEGQSVVYNLYDKHCPHAVRVGMEANMKFFKAVAITVLICMCLAGCGGQVEQQTPPPADTSAPDAEQARTVISLVENGKSNFSIVRSENVTGAEQHLFVSFHKELVERTGVSFKYIEALDRLGYSEDAPEMLLGLTNREDSQLLVHDLMLAGGERFGIRAAGCKISVAGTNSYQTYLGLCYFLDNFVSEGEGGGRVDIEDGFEYISPDGTGAGFDFDSIVAEERGFVFAPLERAIEVPSVGTYTNMQGICDDGKYAYVSMIDHGGSPERALIHKFDLATGELVKSSQPLDTRHTNDMTYDSKNHRLVISRLGPEDGGYGICIVDPDTLELTETFNLSTYNIAIEYLPTTDQYIAATGSSFCLLDYEFNMISSFENADTRFVKQGFCSDEKYVYDVRYDKGAIIHYIVVFDMDGNYLGTGKLLGAKGEPESMYVYEDELYLGCCFSDVVYKLEIIPEILWE